MIFTLSEWLCFAIGASGSAIACYGLHVFFTIKAQDRFREQMREKDRQCADKVLAAKAYVMIVRNQAHALGYQSGVRAASRAKEACKLN